MSPSFIFTVVWFLVLGVIATAAFVYLDAPEFGMDTRTWVLRTIFMPLVGFFWYVLERQERERVTDSEESEAQFVDGPFKIHKSRADDAPWKTSDESSEVRTEDDELATDDELTTDDELATDDDQTTGDELATDDDQTTGGRTTMDDSNSEGRK